MRTAVLLGFTLVFTAAVPRGATGESAPSATSSNPQELADPGPAHEELSAYAGTWDVNIRLGAGEAAMEYAGTATNRMIIGNRFLLCEIGAESDQRAFEGMFTIGFDRRHSEYTIQSIDTWGTYFVAARGKREDASGVIKLYGADDDPHLKSLGLTKEFAYVLDLRDADRYVIEVLMIDTRTEERREMKMMEYEFARSE